MRLFIVALLFLSACITVNKTQSAQTEEGNGYREWSGPGFYWGVYINNENDYWNHYNHYHGQGRGGPHDGRQDGRDGGPHGGGGGGRR